LFEGVWSDGAKHTVWMSHGDRITQLPPGFVVKGVSENAPYAAIEDEKRKFYGLMFHPEVVHTPEGAALIQNFVPILCGLQGRLDHGRLQARGDCAHKGAGGHGQGAVRAFGRG
jgi:GMP synthase (glutamine-hydrolysing)